MAEIQSDGHQRKHMEGRMAPRITSMDLRTMNIRLNSEFEVIFYTHFNKVNYLIFTIVQKYLPCAQHYVISVSVSVQLLLLLCCVIYNRHLMYALRDPILFSRLNMSYDTVDNYMYSCIAYHNIKDMP